MSTWMRAAAASEVLRIMRRCRRTIAPAIAVLAIIGAASCTADETDAGDARATADTGAQPPATSAPDTAAAGTARRADSMQVRVWFVRAEEAVPLMRRVPADADTLGAALRALLAGPTGEERQAGLTSWFSAETADALHSAHVDGALATVDLRDLRNTIPNASSSLGSQLLLDALNGTVFDASAADSVEYRLDGSCEAFGEFVQRGCMRYARER